MNAIKRITIIAVAAIAAAALCSCGKENAEGSSSALIGTWELDYNEYTFCGKSVGSEVFPDAEMLTFRKDGICESPEKEEDGGLIANIQYKYSEKSKTLSLIMWMIVIEFKVINLNATDLVFSCPSDFNIFQYVDDKYKIGEKVDTYRGVAIYEYCCEDDGEYVWEGEYCYKDSKGNIVPCNKISDEEFDGPFTGDNNGYYDTIVSHLKRVK